MAPWHAHGARVRPKLWLRVVVSTGEQTTHLLRGPMTMTTTTTTRMRRIARPLAGSGKMDGSRPSPVRQVKATPPNHLHWLPHASYALVLGLGSHGAWPCRLVLGRC